jgi:membrane associated rhomboid family serine protease
MFPLRDENPTLLTPFVTVGLILINVAVWLYVQGAGYSSELLTETVCRYGMIPVEITGGPQDLVDGGMPCRLGGLAWGGAVTSMFLHGGWMHLIGNMWFLWLFGNNVEDAMGRARYAVFYLLVGVAAAAAHLFAEPGSVLPTVGASGAISGVMGAYLVLYPRVRVQTLFIFIFFIRIIAIPAWVVLLEWFVVQLLSSSASGGSTGGVAFWAHIGGFVAGVAAVKLFENPELVAARAKLRVAGPEPPMWG